MGKQGTATPTTATLAVMDEERVKSGARLGAFIRARAPRDKGGIRALCRESKVSPEAFYRWEAGATVPELESLGRIGARIGVRRSALVAVYDGESPDAMGELLLDPQMRLLLEELVEGRLTRLLAQR